MKYEVSPSKVANSWGYTISHRGHLRETGHGYRSFLMAENAAREALAFHESERERNLGFDRWGRGAGQ